jgi:septum formation topological specificity factor MinE
LKYAKKDAPKDVEALREEAIEQIHRYVASPKLQTHLNGTTLHKIVAVFQGFEIAVCEEVE